MQISEFKASVVYRASSRTARAVTQRKPCLKTKIKTTKQNKKLQVKSSMVTYAFNPSTWEVGLYPQRQVGFCQFKTYWFAGWCWHIPLILALGRQRQADLCEF